VSEDNIEEMVGVGTTAHVDGRGTRWPHGAWAEMNTQTIGRQASTRGVVDAVGQGGKVIVDVDGCDYCQEFAGEAVARRTRCRHSIPRARVRPRRRDKKMMPA
jgi:hypothetical protein